MTLLISLEYHKLIAEKGHIKAKVLPAFRPDRLINIEKTDFTDYIKSAWKYMRYEHKKL